MHRLLAMTPPHQGVQRSWVQQQILIGLRQLVYPHLVSELQNNPNLSLDEVLSLTSDDALTISNPSQPKHHMTIVQYGQNTANSTECRDSEKQS